MNYCSWPNFISHLCTIAYCLEPRQGNFVGSWRDRVLVIRKIIDEWGNYFQGKGTHRIARQHDIVETATEGRTFASSPAWTVKNLDHAFNVSYRWRALEIHKCSILKAQLMTINYSTSIMTNHKNYNFLNCDWFKKLLFPTNSLPKLLSDSLLSDSLLSDSSM